MELWNLEAPALQDGGAQEGHFAANSQLKKAEKTLTFVIRFG